MAAGETVAGLVGVAVGGLLQVGGQYVQHRLARAERVAAAARDDQRRLYEERRPVYAALLRQIDLVERETAAAARNDRVQRRADELLNETFQGAGGAAREVLAVVEGGLPKGFREAFRTKFIAGYQAGAASWDLFLVATKDLLVQLQEVQLIAGSAVLSVLPGFQHELLTSLAEAIEHERELTTPTIALVAAMRTDLRVDHLA